MKRKFCLLLLLCTKMIIAQYTLTTPDGKMVDLNENGTWTYQKEDPFITKYISKNQNFTLEYNNRTWKKVDESKWDIELETKNGVLTARFYESKNQYSKGNIKKLLQEQFETSGKLKDFTVTEKTINGMQALYFEFRINYSGNSFYYNGITYSGENGSFQLNIGGMEWLFELNRKQTEDLINGLRKNY